MSEKSRFERITEQHKDKKLMSKCYDCEELIYGCDKQQDCPKEEAEKNE